MTTMAREARTERADTTELRIRRGRRTDYEPLAALGGWAGVEGDTRRSIRMFRRVVADLGCDLYVADENGDPIGLVTVSYTRVLALGGPRAVLDDLVVREDRRGAGVGRRLLDFALRRARKRGVKSFWAVPADERARRFLERSGFRTAAQCCEWRPETGG